MIELFRGPQLILRNTDDLERADDGRDGAQGQINLGIRFANPLVTPCLRH